MPEHRPTILVIDDDESVLDYTVQALQALGYNATGAADAEGALQLIRKMPSIQLLLSDICLKAGTGPDLVRQALRHRPELKVVFMTGGFADVTFRRTDPLLRKPFRLAELRTAIHSMLQAGRPAHNPLPATLERRRRSCAGCSTSTDRDPL
jgi:two-component system cell cycle sensor histidine kinase/response regulator CckA